MRRFATALAAIAVAFSTVAAAPSFRPDPPEGVDYAIELAKKGDSGTVEGASGTGGTNFWVFVGAEDPNMCNSSDYSDFCEKTLVTTKAAGKVVVDLEPGYPVDFDLYVYEWDGSAAGAEVAHSANNPGEAEHVEFTAKKGGEYLVVVYFFLAGGGYTMTAGLG